MATTNTIHDFATSKARGEAYEQLLDDYLEPAYTIRKATMAEQRLGIDRFLVHKETGETFSVDYKADLWAARTGHAFIETVSVDPASGAERRAGWALTSHADFIFYYLPQKRRLFVVRTNEIRMSIPLWRQVAEETVVHNDGYDTHGLLIKLSDLERIAEAVVEVGE